MPKPMIDSMAQLGAALRVALAEFRWDGPPDTDVAVVEAVADDWCMAWILDRYELGADVQRHFLRGVVERLVAEIEADDPHLTDAQLLDRVHLRLYHEGPAVQ